MTAHETPASPTAAPTLSKPAPRLRRADRTIIVPEVTLDDLLPEDHPARLVWEHIASLDLSPLLAKIRAVVGGPGAPAIDPQILLALWLYATLEGVGSARRLDQLCRRDHAYRWICGGVRVNYHTLSDFRVQNDSFLDPWLTDHVAALMHEELVTLQRTAQDGMRVRASAGAASFRRRPTLEECRKEAQQQVEQLRRELESDPAAGTRRERAARQRAARERQERLDWALEALAELEQQKQKRKPRAGEKPAPARASTTDPEARKMKMPDGGYRPGYNFQMATDVEAGIIVGVDVTNIGNDGEQMPPMIEQLVERYGQAPKQHLIDGGFASHDAIEEVTDEHQVQVYAPVRGHERRQAQGKDPYAPRRDDTPHVRRWRERMSQAASWAIYKLRAATAEWINAQARNRGLYQVRVRGLHKVKQVALWHALAHNFLQALKLRARVAAAALATA